MARSNLILRVDDMSLASRSQSMEDGMDEGKDDKANLEIILFEQSLQSYIIVSISDGFRRAHRLSLPGQRMTNYLKFLQELAVRQASGTAMASQLFSTAVISGSSSVPNLGASNTGNERNFCMEAGDHSYYLVNIGEDGTPTIRPLETLHNALSLRQVDTFLDHVTSANFKTPNHSPSTNSSPESRKTPVSSSKLEDEETMEI